MKNKRFFAGILMLIFMLCITVPISASAATYKWKSIGNGDKQCYRNGKLVKNKWVDNRHLNAQGIMDRNKWVKRKIDGHVKTVFVRNDGRYVPNFKGGWQKIGSKYYYYSKSGKLYRSKWIRLVGKRYYINKNGYRLTGLVKMPDGLRYFTKDGVNKTGWRTIGGKKYYFHSQTRAAVTNGIFKFKNGDAYYFDSKGVMQTGWKKVNGNYYYFKDKMLKDWQNIDNKRYYFNPQTGQRMQGICSINGKLYCFHVKTGEQIKNKTVSYKGRKYIVDKNGLCTLIPDMNGPSSKMLFFLAFESGSQAYNQTGGDNGSACGAYQFDYRYSLLNFVKYAYSQNAALCREFKPYVGLASGYSLKNNHKFYAAWHKIYSRDKKAFSALQDVFAKQNYYDPVEYTLARAGINLAGRPDAVKGAVYSYSIQHGASSAVNAVKAVKLNSEMSNKAFLKKLYSYRIRKFPAYENRYIAEYNLALRNL